MGDEVPSGAAPESRAEAALRRAMHSAPLPPEALERIRSAVAAEWRDGQAPRVQSRGVRLRRYAVAASVALALLSGWWSWERAGPGEILGVVQSHGPVGLVAHRGLLGDTPLGHGAALRSGQSVTALATTEVALRNGGALVMRQGAVVTVSPPQTITLQSGSLYVDLDPAGRHGELRVRTPLGELRHVGTQFEVTVRDGDERIAVREGAVRYTGHTSALVAAGQAIVLDHSGIKATEAVRPYDRAWSWVEAATAPPTIEGQSAAAFLHWLSRATGKRLVWGDDEAGQLAERTTLHGSIENLAIDVAAATVLATTSLRVRIDDSTIFVAADPAAKPAR